MFAAGVMQVFFLFSGNLGGGNFAVLVGHYKHLVAAAFNGAGFVRVNMAARGAVNAVEWAQGGGDNGKVGLRACHHKINVRIRAAAFFLNQRAGSFAVCVLAVACCFFKIGCSQNF